MTTDTQPATMSAIANFTSNHSSMGIDMPMTNLINESIVMYTPNVNDVMMEKGLLLLLQL